MYVTGEEGEIEEEVTEMETSNCFAFISDFYDLAPSAQRLINEYDVRNNMECVRRRDLNSLQVRSPERWLSQPRYSF